MIKKSIKLGVGLLIAMCVCISMLYSDTVWVDMEDSRSADEDGTQSKPYSHLTEGIQNTPEGGMVSVKGKKSIYGEGKDYVITKNMIIVNRWGSGAENFTIGVYKKLIIDSDPPRTATVGTPYTYDVNARDPGRGIEVSPVLNYTLSNPPEGMSVDSNSGLITWTPTSGSPESTEVTIRAETSEESDLQAAVQTFTITVTSQVELEFEKLYDSDTPSVTNYWVTGLIRLYNRGITDITLSDLKFRFYYTTTASDKNFEMWWTWYQREDGTIVQVNESGGLQNSDMQATFTPYSPAENNVNHYVDMTLNSDKVLATDRYVQFQFAVSKGSGDQMDDDYSYSPMSSLTSWSNIPVYLDGQKVWGNEPGGPVRSSRVRTRSVSTAATDATSSPSLSPLPKSFTETVEDEIGTDSEIYRDIRTATPYLRSWLDASQVTYITRSSSDEISEWKDLSGNENNATQSNSGNQPVYTIESPYAKVQLDGVDNFLNIPAALMQGIKTLDTPEFTYVFVLKWGGGSSLQRIFDFGAGTGQNFFLSPSDGDNQRPRVTFKPAGSVEDVRHFEARPLAQNQKELIVVTFKDNNEMTLSVGGPYSKVTGTISRGKDFNNLNVATHYIGKSFNSNNYLDAGIYEVLVFDKVLSDGEQHKINHYLAKKWRFTERVDSDGNGIADSAETYPLEPESDPESLAMVNFTTTVEDRIGQTDTGINDVTPNLKLWLDASQGTYMTKDSSNRVSQWQDLSGNGNHANALNPSFLPTYVADAGNRNYIDLNSASLDVTLPPYRSKNVSMFFVYDRQGSVNWDNLLYHGNASESTVFLMENVNPSEFGGTDKAGFYTGSSWVTFSSGVPGTSNIVVLRTTSSEGNIYVNGADVKNHSGIISQQSHESILYTFVPGYYTRMGSNSSDYQSDAHLSEVLVFYDALGAEDVKKITYYLSKKWNLEAIVDSDGDTIPDQEDPYPLAANMRPTNINLSPNSIAENQIGGSTVGTLSVTDEDRGDTYTYRIVSFSSTTSSTSTTGETTTPAGPFEIVGNLLKTKTSTVLDFETQTSYDVVINVNDGQNDFEKNITIDVTDENEAPSNLDLSSTRVAENEANATVGTVTYDDDELGEEDLILSGSDASFFTLNGSTLKVNGTFDYETKNSYVITITATDRRDSALTTSTTFTILVADDVSEGPTGEIELKYYSGGRSSDNWIYVNVKIKNTGATTIQLNQLKIHYYFTKDSSHSFRNHTFDVGAIDGDSHGRWWIDIRNRIRGNIRELSPTKDNADHYIEFTFTGKSLRMNEELIFQYRFSKSSWANFNLLNDYSYDRRKRSYSVWNNIPVYINGRKVWGNEP